MIEAFIEEGRFRLENAPVRGLFLRPNRPFTREYGLTMRRHLSVILAGLASCFPGLAQAQQIRTVEKVATSGHVQKFDYFAAVDPTCRSMGRMAVNLIEPPHGGQVQLADGREYPNFATFNARARCNDRKLPATILSYGAAPGFAGEDAFAIEVVGPLGNVRRVRYHVTVR